MNRRVKKTGDEFFAAFISFISVVKLQISSLLHFFHLHLAHSNGTTKNKLHTLTHTHTYISIWRIKRKSLQFSNNNIKEIRRCPR